MANIVIDPEPRFRRVRRELNQLEREFERTGQTMDDALNTQATRLDDTLSSAADTLNSIGNFSLGAGTGILGALTAISSAAVDARSELEEMEVTFRTFFEGSDSTLDTLSQRMTERVEELALTTPATFQSILQGLATTRGTRGRIEPQNQSGINQRLADIREEAIFSRVFQVRGGIQQLERTRMMLGQGSVRQRRLAASRMVQPLLNQFEGIEDLEGLQGAVEAGRLTGDQLVQGFDQAVEEGIRGFDERVGDLISTQLSNIGDRLFRLGGAFGEPIVGALSDFLSDYFEGGMDDLIEALDDPAVQAGVEDAFENIFDRIGEGSEGIIGAFFGEGGLSGVADFLENNPDSLGNFVEDMFDLGTALVGIGGALKTIAPILQSIADIGIIGALATGGGIIGATSSATSSVFNAVGNFLGTSGFFRGLTQGQVPLNRGQMNMFGGGLGNQLRNILSGAGLNKAGHISRTANTAAGVGSLTGPLGTTSASILSLLTKAGIFGTAAVAPTMLFGSIRGRMRAGAVSRAGDLTSSIDPGTFNKRLQELREGTTMFRRERTPGGGAGESLAEQFASGQAFQNIETSANLLFQLPERFLDMVGAMDTTIDTTNFVTEAFERMNKAFRDEIRDSVSALQEEIGRQRRAAGLLGDAQVTPRGANRFIEEMRRSRGATPVLPDAAGPLGPNQFRLPPLAEGAEYIVEDGQIRAVSEAEAQSRERESDNELIIPGSQQQTRQQRRQSRLERLRRERSLFNAQSALAQAQIRAGQPFDIPGPGGAGPQFFGVQPRDRTNVPFNFGVGLSRGERLTRERDVMAERLSVQQELANLDGEVTEAEERRITELQQQLNKKEEQLAVLERTSEKVQRVITQENLQAQLSTIGAITTEASLQSRIEAARQEQQLLEMDPFAGPNDLLRQQLLIARLEDDREQRLFEDRAATQGFFSLNPREANIQSEEARLRVQRRRAMERRDLDRVREIDRRLAELQRNRSVLSTRQQRDIQLTARGLSGPGQAPTLPSEVREFGDFDTGLLDTRAEAAQDLQFANEQIARLTNVENRTEEQNQLLEEMRGLRIEANTVLKSIDAQISDADVGAHVLGAANALAGAGQFVQQGQDGGMSFDARGFGMSVGRQTLQPLQRSLRDTVTSEVGGGVLGQLAGGAAGGILGALGGFVLGGLFGDSGPPEVPFQRPVPVVIEEVIDSRFSEFLLSQTRDRFSTSNALRRGLIA